MKYLESVKLVQFFLFENEDIPISEITGIFGPNASGKSTIVDAVQIAMFGANGNLVNLNAQADERGTTRSIKSYCLGMQDDTKRARDNSTTYITLVWRDSETKEATSMGVCLNASVDTDRHEVKGRYIVPGVELSMQDHLEIVDNEERPRAWETFRHQLVERSKMTGEDPCFNDSERYIKAVLHALHGSGGVPSFEAFKSAFKFALRMRFDKSVDNIVRQDVLESRPTNIQKFKEVTESFRRLAQMVAQVKAKIADGEKVTAEFIKAEAADVRATTWGGLASKASRGEAGVSLDIVSEAKQEAEEHLHSLQAEYSQESIALENAQRQAGETDSLIMNHAAHKENGTILSGIGDAKELEAKKAHEIKSSLNLIRNTVNQAVISIYLKEDARALSSIVQSMDAALPTYHELNKEQLVALLNPMVKEVSRAVDHLFKAGSVVGSSLNHAESELRISEEAMLRVKSGRTRLRPETERLLSELHDNGIHATPVCDLVRITDSSWQPVIEAYLGHNVEALLVGRDHEVASFSVYRDLTGPRAIYGAKIVAASRQHAVDAASGSVAELIEGDDPSAVAYLRRQFGGTTRAITDAEALAGKSTLTQDGMLIRSGEYNRIKPSLISNLKIGGGSEDQKAALVDEIKQMKAEVDKFKAQLNSINTLMTSLRRISDKDTILSYMSDACDEMHKARNTAVSLSVRLNDSADAEYRNLVVIAKGFKQIVKDLTPKVAKLLGEIGRAEGDFDQLTIKEAEAKTKWELAQQAVKDAENTNGYDLDFAFKQWDVLLEKFDDRYAEMKGHCFYQENEAKKQRDQAITRGSRELGVFREKYREQGSINQDDWRNDRDWMTALISRLRDTELSEFAAQMDEAYNASQETFRTDVAIALSNNVDQLERSMERLNKVLGSCPAFSNGERYRFTRTVRPQLKGLLKFVKDIAAHGPHDDLFGGAGETPEEFSQLLEDKIAPGAAGMQNPLDDYREFFEFDIEILREDSLTNSLVHVGNLSKRIGTGSGGEHRAPLYVIAGAALASAYRLENGKSDGIRLMLLDEAFNKMDAGNIVATMRYLEQLGLQILMVSPGDNLGTLTAFLHRYYDILRDAENSSMLLEGHDVSAEVREMFRSDLSEFNDELMSREVENVRASRNMQLLKAVA